MYRLVIYPEAQEQIAALPDEALNGYADVLGVLEQAPWSGQPQHEGIPEGAVRRWVFGPDGTGHMEYLILEDAQTVLGHSNFNLTTNNVLTPVRRAASLRRCRGCHRGQARSVASMK